ncbi:radial spoke head protein 9 homolog [Bacillus rossius redtenbacheri]|uniref:radial spoke head protein 9 homolog n=1 Tax=Bacillus rossius redtenbacheri TaxID=93214 RepID=UPI002FDD408A
MLSVYNGACVLQSKQPVRMKIFLTDMNIYNIRNSLEYMRYSGNTISNEYSVILKNSLVLLQNENKLLNVYFWGKIFGLQRDYFVSFGYEHDALIGLKYYYSTDGAKWGLMPVASEQAQYLSPYCSTRFQGDPALQLDVKQDLPPQSGDSELPFSTTLKEEDRLAAAVKEITEEGAVLPRGALHKRCSGDVVQSQVFKGLTKFEALQLKYYLHWRSPREKWTKNLLVHPKYNYSIDFLDTIAEDVPSGSWSIQVEDDGRLVIFRSLMWTGMTFYHLASSPDFGFAYFGYGKRNIDIPFML